MIQYQPLCPKDSQKHQILITHKLLGHRKMIAPHFNKTTHISIDLAYNVTLPHQRNRNGRKYHEQHMYVFDWHYEKIAIQ